MNALLMPFLYFPEDKAEYIPAAISFVFFMILLVSYLQLDSSKFQETRRRDKRT